MSQNPPSRGCRVGQGLCRCVFQERSRRLEWRGGQQEEERGRVGSTLAIVGEGGLLLQPALLVGDLCGMRTLASNLQLLFSLGNGRTLGDKPELGKGGIAHCITAGMERSWWEG